MLFDYDRFADCRIDLLDSLHFAEFEETTLHPLDLLPADFRRVPIALDVRVPLKAGDGDMTGSESRLLIVRDRFEWDLDSGVRPIEFAENLARALNLEVDPQVISDSILDQITAFLREN